MWHALGIALLVFIIVLFLLYLAIYGIPQDEEDIYERYIAFTDREHDPRRKDER